jgi:hypothetical protein
MVGRKPEEYIRYFEELKGAINAATGLAGRF